MKIEVTGTLPSWVSDCSDELLRTRLGQDTQARGSAYASAGAVAELRLLDDGRAVSATVHGSGHRNYVTTVTLRPGTTSSGAVWVGRCSCPMQVDCKHVAAVLIITRGWLERAAPSDRSVSSDWQRRLLEAVSPETTDRRGAPLALQFALTTQKHRPGSEPLPARLRLRPVTAGKSGRWIRTGVSWNEVDRGYGSVKIEPAQRDVIRAFLLSYRASQPSYVSIYGEPQVHLDDLGPRCWRLLEDARQTGFAFIDSLSRPVDTASAPASVFLDARQATPDEPLELSVAVRVPGDTAWAQGDMIFVGTPPHGAYVDGSDRLTLVPFLRPMDASTSRLLAGGTLRVPAGEIPTFLSRFYPSLRQRITVQSADGTVDFPEVEPPKLALHVRFEPGHVAVLDWLYAYRVAGESVLVRETDQLSARDRVAEQALLAAVASGGEVPGLYADEAGHRLLASGTRLTGFETAQFVQLTLPELASRDDVLVEVTGEAADYAESTGVPLIAVSASDARDGSSDWFDLLVEVSIDGQEVPLADLLVALSSGDEHVILPSGTWFRCDRPELLTLRRLVEEARSLQDKQRPGLRLTAFHAGLWEELVGLGVVQQQSERWTRAVGALLAMDEAPRPDPPASLQATLRPYQLAGYTWLSLLWDNQLGGILADDMGLGKTVQTLAMVARAHERGTLGGSAGPLLVVAPTSVVGTWASEAARFVPTLNVVAITETGRRSGAALPELTRNADVVVTSYALLRIDEDAYREVTWSGLVLDEAQFVKNHQARTYACARRLAAPFKLAITGTPLENSLMDLWSMLSITAPGLFPHPDRFAQDFRRPIESGQAPEQLAVLRRRIRPLMLRRTKEQVAVDLPPKIEQILDVTLNPGHRKVYDRYLVRERQRVLGLLDDLQRNRIAILRSLTVLRQLSLDASLVDAGLAGKIRASKVDVLMEHLHEVANEGHRALVFSQFTGFLSVVRERLAEEGIDYCYLDGRTRNRPARIAEFTQGDAPVFLISLKAGGVGLTLTEADYVFVLDPWWNPATEAQAVDRAHRIGQDKTVMVYRLVATDTIEEKVVALQQRKRDLFARVVDGDAMKSGALTEQDIRALFEP